MFDLSIFILIDCCIEWTDTALNILFPLMLNWGMLWLLAKMRMLVFSIALLSDCCLCGLEHREPSGRAVFSFITRSPCSSFVDEDCDSLALCDPMQRMNCEVDSLPESCFDSGLSTLRDSNEYDSEVECKQQRGFQRSHGTQESLGGDASDTDVSPRSHCSPRPFLWQKSVNLFDFYLSRGCVWKVVSVKCSQ